MADTAALLKEATDTLRSLLARGKETQDDGIRMILGPKGWSDTIALIARADASLKDAAPLGEPMDPRFLPTRRDLAALRDDAAAMRGAGLPAVVNVAPRVLYLAWPNGQYDHANPESSRWRCVSFNLPE